MLSDLRSRRAVIAGGVTVWSAFTFLSGLVNNFGQLFTCRALVGVGEAAYGPAAASLVADYFPARGRAVAMGILSSGIALGGVLGLLLGGQLEGVYGWRVAFMTVGVPGFIMAPSSSPAWSIRPGEPARLTVRSFLRDFEIGVLPLLRNLLAAARRGRDRRRGGLPARQVVRRRLQDRPGGLQRRGRARPRAHHSPMGAAHASDDGDETPFGSGISGAFDDIVRALRIVLHTPTLVYVFTAGAMISFGMNGIVGWGPTFVSRELKLERGRGGEPAGQVGTDRGHCGHAVRRRAGRLAAPPLRDGAGHRRRGRAAASAGRSRSGCSRSATRPCSRPVFVVAFFCLSWYNGPMTAVIFDVVPARISATVAGAYLLFIHLAGDAIALPLVGTLSDRFGLDRAVCLLPAVVIIGGITVLGARRTVGRDMHRHGASSA